jgi:RND family efflux transporter MFP subunit
MKPKILILLVAVLLAVVSGGYFYSQYAAGEVRLVQPVYAPAVQAVYATGTVEPSVLIPIAPRSTGVLAELLVDEGDTVAKGQVLARLDDSDLVKNIEELKAKEVLAKKEYERKSALISKGAVSQSMVDQADAEWQATHAALDRATVQMDFLKLQAPEEGLIIRRDGEMGAVITVNQPVFWMACCAPLRVTVEVDEEDIPLVKTGQDVLLHADAFPDKIFNGVVQSITPKGDPVARSYRVRVGLTGETPLMTGMTSEANIITLKKDKALLVPRTAYYDGYVLVVEDGVIRRKAVKTGIEGRDSIEILEGISAEALLVAVYDQSLPDVRRFKKKVSSWSPAEI